MELNAQTQDDVMLVTANASRIDASVAIQFKDQMRDLTDGGPTRIVLDMAQVDFIDSSGLGAVVAAMKLVGSERKLELANLTPTVAKVFKLTRMDGIFIIHDDLDAFKLAS
ncbi:STAS domain-containing protein [Algirhabdus cladophorae]|uniref:STAS domain-containing protein n=1 Tax=Algirhabdus cladophorae TaxID=3377108 RepID=UPI003B845D5F